MGILPKSRTARRRLSILAMIAPVLVLAVILVLYSLGDNVSLFLTPSQAKAQSLPPGRTIQLGGLVTPGSLVKHPDGRVEFMVSDNVNWSRVTYQGNLPDLFREGQGVVAKGAFQSDGVFNATQVLAKHDEKYMPRELEKALKETGQWKGEGPPPPAYGGGDT